MARRSKGPGPAKVRWAQAISRRALELLAVRGGWWSTMLERADVVSEGGMVDDADGSTYFGSTSLRCPVDERSIAGGPARSHREILELLLADPHARVRLLRIAQREASARARSPLGVLHAEISGKLVDRDGARYLSIDIDVSAAVARMEKSAL